MRFFLLAGLLVSFYCLDHYSQNLFNASVRDSDSGDPLPNVNVVVSGTAYGGATDLSGRIVIEKIPDGRYEVIFSYIGYKNETIILDLPDDTQRIFEIFLDSEAEEFEEITVTSTRASRLIDDEPTRVEVIAGEEIDEKISMDPSSISMVLNESTGIQVQQTSASSVNNSFRIQGLDGKYTQLLKDGFPLYSGFSGSLSIAQILPLDLKQIEIIKGSSSTLYGGGAIAGLINLVSKKPDEKRDLSILLNATSALGLDASLFYSEKFETFGFSFFGSRNSQRAYDNNDDKFSDLPETERYTINPRLFIYPSESLTLEFGAALMTEERLGGSIPVIRGNSDSVFTYTEKNVTGRVSTQTGMDYRIDNSNSITVKNSFGFFNREIRLPGYLFEGNQISSFSEISYSYKSPGSDWIFGVNLITDDFTDHSPVTLKRDYSELTAGAFLQSIIDISELLILESGFRADYNENFGWFALPRMSLLLKWNNNLTSRIGGGLGYNLPDIFTEDAEKINFQNILPIDKNNVDAETSYGINFDFNYRTIILDDIALSLNQLFFYTRINDPAVLIPSPGISNANEFNTIPGHFDTRGSETNIRISIDHLKFFVGYTYVDARVHKGENIMDFELTPRHKLGLVLIYEKHGDFRIGLEGYYTGRQLIPGGTRSRDYWVNGIMIEKIIGAVNLFLNFENIFDTRQSRYGAMYTGSPSSPEFVEIYAPTDGRIINGGIKLRF